MPTAISTGGPYYDIASITYTGPIRRLSAILVVVSHFVEVILVELPDEAREVAVLEMFRQDGLGEPFILRTRSISRWGLCLLLVDPRYLENHKASAIVTPSYDLGVGWILQHS